MLHYLSYLSNPIVLAVVGGVLLVVALYLDDKYNEQNTSWTDYFKLFCTGTVVTGFVLFIQKLNVKSLFGGSSGYREKVADVEGMSTGLPDF